MHALCVLNFFLRRFFFAVQTFKTMKIVNTVDLALPSGIGCTFFRTTRFRKIVVLAAGDRQKKKPKK